MDVRTVRSVSADEAAKRQQIAGLNGLRAVAALAVMIGHVSQYTGLTWLALRGFGPIALFVLSGFLLFRPYARWAMGMTARPSTRSFAVRRALRIFPAYWVVLHVVYLVVPGAAPRSLGEWAGDLVLFNALRLETMIPSLAQVWSIGVEVTWYVALPLIGAVAHLVVARRAPATRYRVLAALMIATVPVSFAFTWLVLEGHVPGNGMMWLPRYLCCFAVGALVALTLEAGRTGAIGLGGLRAVAGSRWVLPVVIVAAAAVLVSPLTGGKGIERLSFVENTLSLAAAMTIVGCLLLLATLGNPAGPWGRVLSAPFMQTTGRWSYGIFLWHLPVIAVLAVDVAFPAGVVGHALWYVSVIAISYVLGWASYAWVEEPLMLWSREITPGAPASRVVRTAPADADAVETAGVVRPVPAPEGTVG